MRLGGWWPGNQMQGGMRDFGGLFILLVGVVTWMSTFVKTLNRSLNIGESYYVQIIP